MNCLFILVLLSMFLNSNVDASEVALIEDDAAVSPLNQEISHVHIHESNVEIQNSNKQDDSNEIENFIKKEDEKLKDIKMLNLDLEKANLELKKREVEQKMYRLEGNVTNVILEKQKDIDKPILSLVAIFEVSNIRSAIISVNGSRMNLKGGQEINGFIVKEITERMVVIQSPDGEKHELFLP